MNDIQTALGTVKTTDLGRTLSHEHIFINLLNERRGDGLLSDPELMIAELSVFAQQGGGTIFDLTTAELTPGSVIDSEPGFTAGVRGETREPASVRAIQRVSKATGINVVLGTGRYRDPFLSRSLVDSAGIDGLVAEMVRDIQDGFPGTTARAGIIGEIGADKWFISATEERVFRASARAHLQTGIPIYTHAARWPVGLEQLALLTEEGVDPSRIATGHADTVPDKNYALKVAATGAYVGIDTINSGLPTEVAWRVDVVTRLIRAGHGSQILLAHDVCLTSQLASRGGNGFGFVLGPFRDALLNAGVTTDEFEGFMVTNPTRFITPGNQQ